MVLEAEAEDNPAGPVPLPAGLPVPEALAAQSGALPQGSDMLTTFLSLMPDAAVAVDGKGTIVAVNERTESFFGYSAQEVEGKNIELLVPERFRHSHRRRRAEYSADPRTRPMGAGLDLYARRKDGSEFPVDISLAPIGGGGGGELVVAAIRDITERKAAQSAQAQLAAIVQSSADGIFSMSHRGVITSWNPGAEAMFGFSPEEVVGRHIGLFFPDDPVLEELLDDTRSGHIAHSKDTRWQRREGKSLDVAISVSPLALGDEPGFSVLVRDITVHKEAEAQLRRQARWQAATAEIRLSLLSEASLKSSLRLVCKWAAELANVSAAALVVVEGGRSRTAASYGERDALAAVSHPDQVATPVTQAIASGRPATAATNRGSGHHARAFPLTLPGKGGPLSAALVLLGEAAANLGPDADDAIGSLATHAILAFELANVRAERDRLLISADRERIARDLHDLVIQRLFGAGLRLQGALALIDNPQASARVASTVDDLDVTIKEIREAIFALESAPGTDLRAKALEAMAYAAESLGFRPSVSFHGPTDVEIALPVQLEAVAVLREALSNAARHAHATRVEVDISLEDELIVLVIDNGVGIGSPGHLSGIANARARAELLGGSLELSPAEGGGTSFEWRVPLPLAPTVNS
jgi:PAS domain S-box-containing protein